MTEGVFQFAAIKARVDELNGRAESGVAYAERGTHIEGDKVTTEFSRKETAAEWFARLLAKGYEQKNGDKAWRQRQKREQAGLSAVDYGMRFDAVRFPPDITIDEAKYALAVSGASRRMDDRNFLTISKEMLEAALEPAKHRQVSVGYALDDYDAADHSAGTYVKHDEDDACACDQCRGARWARHRNFHVTINNAENMPPATRSALLEAADAVLAQIRRGHARQG